MSDEGLNLPLAEPGGRRANCQLPKPIETAPDHREDPVAQHESNDATLPVQHEVGLTMLAQLFAH